LAEDVGENGWVHGIGTAEPMLAVARERCADQPQATFEPGDATDLSVEDGAFDAAAAGQVYEYVADLEAAFEELYRALRPGGRAVVFDSDWSTLTYHAADEARSERIVTAFDAHCPHPRLARTLKPRLERANFEVTE
jgi:ubiquinone/menaquinone biosynthesis C-methylase UbiE